MSSTGGGFSGGDDQDDMFGATEDFAGRGTESLAPGASGGAPTKSRPSAQTDERLKELITQMEADGLNFNSLFDALNEKSKQGKIPLGQLQKQLEFYYPSISVDDKRYILKQLNVNSGQIDLIELQDLLMKYARNLKPSIGSTFNIIAVKIKSSGLDNKEFFNVKCNW